MDSFKDMETGGIISAFCCPLVILFAIYIWWLVEYGTQKETEIWFLIIMLGILYGMSLYMATTGHPMFASCLIFVNFVFIIAIAAISDLKTSAGNFASLGLSATLTGVGVTGILACVLYSLGKQV